MNDYHLHALIIGVILSLASPAGRAREAKDAVPIGDEVLLRAETVELSDDGGYKAEGGVHLSLGDFTIRTSWAVLTTDTGEVTTGPLELQIPGKGTMKASLGRFNTSGELTLQKPELSLNAGGSRVMARGEKLRCKRGTCTLFDGRVNPCPHPDPGYTLEIDETVIHPSGDMDLSRPVLYLGPVPVLALPWIRLRPPGSAGFTAPVVGYTEKAGFIAGPAGQFPVGEDAMFSGHVAARTSQGLETSSEVAVPGMSARLDHLMDGPENHMRARSGLLVSGERAALASDLDLATNLAAIDDLETDPLERAVPYLRNRLLLSSRSDHLLFETGASYQQAFGPDGSRSGRLPYAVPFASVSLAAPQALGPLSPAIGLHAARYSPADGHLFEAATGLSPSHTSLSAHPTIFADRAFGVLSTRLALGTSHRLWLTDDGVDDALHDLHGGLKIGLPLLGRPFGARHLLTPYVSYYACPWTSGEGPSWIVRPEDVTRTGHHTDAGIETELGSSAKPFLSLSVFQRFTLGGFDSTTFPAFLHGRLATGPLWLRSHAAVTYDQQVDELSAAHLDFSSEDIHGTGISLGMSWYGEGDGPHLHGGFAASPDGAWISAPSNTLELTGGASVSITQRLTLFGRSRIGVHPDISMNALVYGFTFGSRCRCVRVGLTASHRLDEAVPDVYATLSVLNF